jgi:hypothetical protein
MGIGGLKAGMAGTTARITGLLFILATGMGITTAILLGPLLEGPSYLVDMAANSALVRVATLFDFIMAGAVIAIAAALFPVLKRVSETVAVAYLSVRLVEGVVLALAGLSWILLAGLGSGGDSEAIGRLLLGGSDLAFTLGAEIAFGVSAVILNIAFYRARLVPVVISVWGAVGGALLLTLGALKILGMPVASIEVAFTAPIALNEMVLAIWLLVRGFGGAGKTA